MNCLIHYRPCTMLTKLKPFCPIMLSHLVLLKMVASLCYLRKMSFIPDHSKAETKVGVEVVPNALTT